ncbi:MAG: 5-(carboxyamino)imidazole ribonucleotide mutase [Halobacteriota archaeon]
MNSFDVAIIMGSTSDMHVAEKAVEVLKGAGVTYDVQVISAHREPERLDQYIKDTQVKVYIAIAGLAGALPGIIASKTESTVVGVPVSSKLNGLDALLSIVQMPYGVPVASVGIDNGGNGALLALRIIKTSVKTQDSLHR